MSVARCARWSKRLRSSAVASNTEAAVSHRCLLREVVVDSRRHDADDLAFGALQACGGVLRVSESTANREETCMTMYMYVPSVAQSVVQE